MVADIELTQDQVGDQYDILINDFTEPDDIADLTEFDNVTLKVRDLNDTEVLSKPLSIIGPSQPGTVRWPLQLGDYTNMTSANEGEYLAKLVFDGFAMTLVRETEPPMTVKIHPKFND